MASESAVSRQARQSTSMDPWSTAILGLLGKAARHGVATALSFVLAAAALGQELGRASEAERLSDIASARRTLSADAAIEALWGQVQSGCVATPLPTAPSSPSYVFTSSDSGRFTAEFWRRPCADDSRRSAVLMRVTPLGFSSFQCAGGSLCNSTGYTVLQGGRCYHSLRQLRGSTYLSAGDFCSYIYAPTTFVLDQWEPHVETNFDEQAEFTVVYGGSSTARVTIPAYQPTPTARTVSLTLTGNGTGRVTSVPPGLDCTSGSSQGCSANFVHGATVTLTATPTVGSRFAGWTGSCSGSSASLTVTVTGAMSCGANLAAVVPQSGWWWAAAAPGSGYSLEERNGRLFAAAYMYRADGSPAWYLAQGNLTGGPVRMAFHEFGNGQTLTGAWRGPTVRGSVGTATLTISTPTSAALTWDGAASPISLSRYGFAGAPPPAEDRETARPKTPKTPSLGATSVSQDTKRPLAGGLQALRDGTARTVRAIVRLKPAKVEPGQGGPKASSPPAPSAAMSARQSLVAARVIAGGGSLVYRSSLSPVIVVDLTAEGLRGLEARTDVESIADDGLEFLSLSVSAPRVGADRVWNAGHRGAETAVAVLDSGIDTGHPFFGGRIADEACFSTNYSVSDGSGGTHRIHSICPNGATEQFGSGAGRHCADLSLGCYHGTHVAGIAAGSGSAFSGVAPAAKVVGIQVFSRADPYFCGGNPCIGALVSDTLRALEYAYGNAARWNLAAVNMSLGGARHAGYCDQDPRKPAIDNLRSLGVATVIAAGNDYETAKVAAPSCISSAVRVSATFSTSTGDDVEIYANEWALPLILAPGTSINSADPGGGFARRSGTSMAAPHVAGAWALIRSVLPSVGVDRVYDALASTGAPVRSTYTDRTYPRIDVAAALGVLDPLPETGWWWNASEPGRGFFLEVQGRTVFVSAYAYDETGRAEWYISQNALIRGGAYQGTWQKFVDGQSLGGAWRAPRAVGDVGTVALRFSGPRNAVLTLPTGVEIPIARFTF